MSKNEHGEKGGGGRVHLRPREQQVERPAGKDTL